MEAVVVVALCVAVLAVGVVAALVLVRLRRKMEPTDTTDRSR